jgi:DNA-binding NtrC family response regulator
VLPLAEYFLQREAKERRLKFSAAAKKALQAYRWPGNVRELENAVQRAVVCAAADTIEPGDLSAEMSGVASDPASRGDWWGLVKSSARDGDLLAAAEKILVERALRDSGGNVQKAAEILGVTRAALRTRIDRHGLTGKE